MLFVLCQLFVAAVVLALCALVAPVPTPSIVIGLLAVVVPNAVFTFILRNANPGALVMFAFIRSFIVAISVILGGVLFKPIITPYFIGVGGGIAVITFVPIALTLLRSVYTSNDTKA